MNPHRVLSALAFFLLLAIGRAAAEDRPLAPIERSGFSIPTPYDSLQRFLESLSTMPGFRTEVIAQTAQGRAVTAVLVTGSPVFGADTTKLRALLFAQQHGDEISGKEALSYLLARLSRGDDRDILQTCDLIVVPLMNPDGAERGERRTTTGFDLNRSHALLICPETFGLHELFERWRPEVTLDIHEYGAFSESWIASGRIKRADVQLGLLTNLNSPEPLRRYQRETVFPAVSRAMDRAGFFFHEYLVGSPGERHRHSTTEVNDGRQSFGILGTLSFIQEGRRWRSFEEQLERRTRAQLTSALALVRAVGADAAGVRALVRKEREVLRGRRSQPFVLRMEHVADGRAMVIPVVNMTTVKDTVWSVSPYHGSVTPLESIPLPSAYVFPDTVAGLVDLLHRHHVFMRRGDGQARSAFEFTLERFGTAFVEDDTVPDPIVSMRTITLVPGVREIVVPTDQERGLLIATMLEPRSMWGLFRYRQFAALTGPGVYPIRRIP